jgi:hypothetical protein
MRVDAQTESITFNFHVLLRSSGASHKPTSSGSQNALPEGTGAGYDVQLPPLTLKFVHTLYQTLSATLIC